MAEQWDQATGDSRGPGGPGLNRNALQATLADLVRDADGPGAGGPAAAAAPSGGRPVVPGAPVPTPSSGVRPLRGPSAGRPVVDFDEIEGDEPSRPAASAPVPGGEVPRPSASGRPRPFGPEHVPPAPNGNGPAGAVRPGSGVSGGFSSSVGGGGGFGGGGDAPIGAGSLSGRITPGGGLGDNLARLTPAPTEQPTVPLRRRRPEAPKDEADKPAAPPVAAAAAPQPRPMAIEAWSPNYDDILPQRPTRSGRSFRRAR